MKAKFIKIGTSILILIAIIFLIWWVLKAPKIESGTIHLVVIDETSTTIIEEDIDYESTSEDPITLRKILETHYDVVVEGGMLVGIEGHNADNSTYFWKIWINCEMANRGIDTLYFEDGDEIKIIFTAVGDYGNDAC
jgi:hypothetical protein